MNKLSLAWKPWLFLFPAALIYLAVILVPSLYTLVLSFFSWNGASSEVIFVGWDNYIQLFATDTVFQLALWNTFLWTLASIVVKTALALFLALVLNQAIRGRFIFRSVYYFPSVLSGIVVAITWRWMYHPTQGLINAALTFLGLGDSAPAWLAEPGLALWSVFVTSLWFGLGQPLVLFLAGLQTIPKDPYEAALLDGASPWQQLTRITVPMLRETFVVVLATIFIAGMRIYDLVFAMTGGGPAESTQVLASWMYFQTFTFANVGLGSAISWILVILSLVVVIPYVRFTAKRSEH